MGSLWVDEYGISLLLPASSSIRLLDQQSPEYAPLFGIGHCHASNSRLAYFSSVSYTLYTNPTHRRHSLVHASKYNFWSDKPTDHTQYLYSRFSDAHAYSRTSTLRGISSGQVCIWMSGHVSPNQGPKEWNCPPYSHDPSPSGPVSAIALVPS